MKKVFTAILAISFLISCSSDSNSDEEVIDAAVSLVGTWDAVSFTTTTAFDLNGDGTTSNDLFDELSCFASEITFSSDGTYSAMSSDLEFVFNSFTDISADCNGTFTEMGTYELEGNTLTLDSEEDEPTAADVTIDGDVMTVSQVDPDLGPVTLVLQKR